MIELSNITKYYHENMVLKNVSIEIIENSIIGIIGPNGAGKTTLLNIISGFDFADSGRLYIKKKEMSIFSQRRKYISYMPENIQLYPNYFVGEFIKFIHSAGGYKNSNLFDLLSFERVLNKRIKHLSKGWHQRLKLYTALCNDKPIVILDEPFDGFDPLQMRIILDILKKMKKDHRTFILSLHQLIYAQKICDYFVFLDDGKIIASGSLSMLLERFSCKTESLEELFLRALEK